MTEILSILTQFVIFLLLFSIPFTPINLTKLLNLKKGNLNFIDAHVTNIIFFSYLSLIFSFLNINLQILFNTYLLIAFFMVLINLTKFNFKNINFYLCLVFILVVLSIFFSLAQNLKIEWDGHHWIEKVLVFYNGESVENLINVLLPSYPHLGSYIWAFFWKNSLMELEYFGRYFHVYFYISSIYLVLNIINLRNDFSKILTILFLVLITYDLYLFSGYQEYLIFSTLVLASRYITLINFNNLGNLRLVFLIITILYTMCWFKNEGTIYYIIFTLTLIFYLKVDLKYKITLLTFTAGLLIIQITLQNYFIGVYSFQSHTNLNYVLSNLSSFNVLIDKSVKILMHTMIAFIKYPLWILICASILYHFLFIKKFDIHSKYFISCLILNLGFLFSIFFSFINFDLMLTVALDRLIFQTSGFYIILILICFNKTNFFKRNSI